MAKRHLDQSAALRIIKTEEKKLPTEFLTDLNTLDSQYTPFAWESNGNKYRFESGYCGIMLHLKPRYFVYVSFSVVRCPPKMSTNDFKSFLMISHENVVGKVVPP